MFLRKRVTADSPPRRGAYLPVFVIYIIGLLVMWFLTGYIEDDCTDCWAYGDCYYYSGGQCYGTIGCITGGVTHIVPPVCNSYRSAIRSVFGQFNSPSLENQSSTPTPDNELNPAN